MLKLRAKKNPRVRVLVTDKVEILFSYETPVAFKDKVSGQIYVTATRHSTTTDGHINDWLQSAPHERTPQHFIDDALNYLPAGVWK
jgi:hypothetical protein